MSTRRAIVGLAALVVLVVAAVPGALGRRPARLFTLDESCTLPHPPQAQLSLTGAAATVDFSPDGGGEQLILGAIRAARSRIRVQAYSFTDRRIQRALEAAKARGVDVEVILDKTDAEPFQHHRPVAAVLAAAGIPVWIDASVRIAHNKVMIIDGADLITGSYNFSYAAAFDNAENLLYIRHAPALAEVYLSNWNWRQSCARPYRKT
ncbi:MAG: phospholipase D family protein [Gammaproteobacteria bacterium]